MQEPFEASLSTLVFYAMSVSETASVPHASLETNNTGDSAQPSALSSDTSLSNAETLQLFSQLLDVKFDQKLASFKRDPEDKEAATQSQLKKLKTESKASNSFTFKGNKVQYEVNFSLHDLVDGAIKNISKGNLLAAISELESVKTLITKQTRIAERRFLTGLPRGYFFWREGAAVHTQATIKPCRRPSHATELHVRLKHKLIQNIVPFWIKTFVTNKKSTFFKWGLYNNF